MLWVRKALMFFAIALVVANAECVARCSALPCHDAAPVSQSEHPGDVPPCHKHHHGPNQTDNPKPCAVSVLVVFGRGVSVRVLDQWRPQMPAIVAPLPPSDMTWSALRPWATETPSPPGSAEAPTCTVLRI